MNLPRYDYLQVGAPTKKVKMRHSNSEISLPEFDRPVSIVENFKRVAQRDKPYWVPNPLTDIQYFSPTDHISAVLAVMGCKEDTRFQDWFGADWTFVVSAGGPMLTPEIQIMDDVTQWEKKVKFPDINKWDFKTKADDFVKNTYDPEKALCMDIGLGCTERLVSVMGGYTDSMLALAMEPEACADFFQAFTDWQIAHFDKLFEHYPYISMLTYHDDWGNEKDTFFSPAMLENMVLPQTKRFFDHVKSKGIAIEFHNCGNISRFLPQIANELSPEFMQIQRRVLDFPAIKLQYGDKLGFCGGIEGFNVNSDDPPKDELIEMVRNTVDALGKGGGLYIGLGMGGLKTPEALWYATNELYAYSSEMYAKER